MSLVPFCSGTVLLLFRHLHHPLAPFSSLLRPFSTHVRARSDLHDTVLPLHRREDLSFFELDDLFFSPPLVLFIPPGPSSSSRRPFTFQAHFSLSLAAPSRPISPVPRFLASSRAPSPPPCTRVFLCSLQGLQSRFVPHCACLWSPIIRV